MPGGRAGNEHWVTAGPAPGDPTVGAALAGARRVPLWLDTPHRPAPRPALAGDLTVDLAVVGGGLTGLWAAVLAAEADPARRVVLLEAASLGWAASGRNGGFCSASLTHGLGNGMQRWPGEMPTLLRLGAENLDAIEDTIERHGIDCGFRRTGELTVAVEPWQFDDLREMHATARGLGEPVELLGPAETRAVVDSPTYVGGLYEHGGTALVDPARLVWGLAEAAARLGVEIHEGSRVTALRDEGDRVRLVTPSGTVLAARVVLGTSAFPSPLRRLRPFVVPVWDHVLATEPLTQDQRASLGWKESEGVSDAGNQFHYYRLTDDDRLVWGGYDALYYFGSDLAASRARRPATEEMLAAHLLATFPQLDGVRFGHVWAGAIDTCSRFTAFWGGGLGGKVAAVQGFTGLGVGASRFGAQVALDLVDGRETERTRLRMVRSKPIPFPPEPLRWAGIEATRRSIAAADRSGGRRNLWLRALDRFGMGFDS
jgi:glycine/D-amino acid oxidase-like deaminating enzyme